MSDIKELVDRFLMWPLPKSVCADPCATDRKYQFPRAGTNLLDADEARQMVEHVFGPEMERLRSALKEIIEQVMYCDSESYSANMQLRLTINSIARKALSSKESAS